MPVFREARQTVAVTKKELFDALYQKDTYLTTRP